MQVLNISELSSGGLMLAALMLLTALLLLAIAWLLSNRRDRGHSADAALLASEAMLDSACRLGGVGGWELNVSTQQLRWSRQTCLMHDLAPDFQPTLQQALAFYAEEGRQALAEAVRSAVESGTSWDLELSLTTAAGRVIWVRVVGEPMAPENITIPDGSAQRLVGSMQDVTARRALEEEMRRSHTILRSVLDNLPCGLSVFDARLDLIAHNKEFIRLLDLPTAIFEGQQPNFESFAAFNLLRDEYRPDEVSEGAEARLRSFSDRPQLLSYERVRPDGTVIEVRAAPMPGGGFILIYSDMTERRRAQADISRSEQLLRGAMDAIDEAFVLFDPQDRIVLLNEKYRSIYADVADVLKPGTSFEELIRARIAANPAHKALQAPGGVEMWVAQRVALHRKGQTAMVQRLDDGRWLRVIERKMPDGHIVGFRIDITDLMRATDAAEKASLAKSQFLANMSHEIRTPMNAVLGMLKLLQRTPMTPRQRDYASKSEGAARSLLRLLNDILDFSKVEAGKMTLDLQPLLLDGLLRDLMAILAATVDDKKNVALRFDIDRGLPRCVVADALRLQQVLINLAGNAIKFTESGEVRLQLRVQSRTPDAVRVDFVVSDTGIGIAAEHQARIFTGFTQAEASTSRRFGGTGLGLAISQRLVQLMGAELKLESALGHGSRFSFSLLLDLPADAAEQGLLDGFSAETATASGPFADTAAQEALLPLPRFEPALARPPGRLKGLYLLVVEDNMNNQQVARELLEDEGAVVSLASDGQQALTHLAQGKRDGLIDAVLMDVQMPVMDGYTATRLIRRQLKLNLPIIAMTANALRVDREACLDVGMDEHVGKPFDIDHLVNVLLRYCGGRETAATVDIGVSANVSAFAPAAPASNLIELPPALLMQAEAADIQLVEALGRMSGKAELFVRMVAALSEEAHTLPRPLTAAALHGFRGLAATLGARALAELAAQGERLLKAEQTMPEGWEPAFFEAIQHNLATLAGLARQLRVDVPRPAASASAAPDMIGALIDLLRGADMAALAAYDELRPGLLAAHPAQVRLLDTALHRLEFDEAIVLCQTLRQTLHEPQVSAL